jgi:proteasome lid subunit RPN8/RPN11
MISIEQEIAELMNEDALHAFPDECCGFMFGIEDAEGNRFITEMQTVQNVTKENRKRRFEISSMDYLKAEQMALDRNIHLLGVYHSHPNHPPIPSEQDRIAAQPFFSYVIISVINNKIDAVRSWQLNDHNQFEEEQIKRDQVTNTN